MLIVVTQNNVDMLFFLILNTNIFFTTKDAGFLRVGYWVQIPAEAEDFFLIEVCV